MLRSWMPRWFRSPRTVRHARSGFRPRLEALEQRLALAAPVAVDDFYAGVAGTPLTATAAEGVLRNDVDGDFDPLTAKLDLNHLPAHGSILFYADGAFTYTPHTNYSGLDSFSYVVTDANHHTDVGTIYLTINPAANVFLVTSAADDYEFGPAGAPGTLRWAINQANAHPGRDIIRFAIGAAGSAQTIYQETRAFPEIEESVLIDGWSQGGPGYRGTPLVTLDGSQNHGSHGLLLYGDHIEVRGLAITNFTTAGDPSEGFGIGMEGLYGPIETSNWIYGNVITNNETQGIYAAASATGNIIGTNADGIFDAVERNVVSGNGRDGIRIGSGNVVAGNYVGVAADGVTALPNGTAAPAVASYLVGTSAGIWATGSGNLIGGTTSYAANVVSGNRGVGIYLPAAGNVVQGNRIGTDAAGTLPVGNQNQGIVLIAQAQNNQIVGNVIAANAGSGVLLQTSSLPSSVSGNLLSGNFIGTDAAAALNLGNLLNGVSFANAAQDNTLSGNVIAYNQLDGVGLFSSTVRNRITGNRFFANADLAIDIFGNGVTANDNLDTDGGPNLSQNHPVLTAATTRQGFTTISGTLSTTLNSGAAPAVYRVEFYSNPTAEPTGFGEGHTYLGFADVAIAPGASSAPFGATLPGAMLPHQYITATATDPVGNTSEFSRAIRQNNAPTVVGEFYQVSEGGTLHVPAVVGLLANDSDADGDPITLAAGTSPGHAAVGGFEILADGSFSYKPAPGFSGLDSFTYLINDGYTTGGVLGTVAILVQPINHAPVAVGDTYATLENLPLQVFVGGVLENDTDPDSDALLATLVGLPAHGQLLLGADGSFLYAPNEDFHGIDSFTYKISDGRGGFDVAAVRLEVIAVNQAPDFSAGDPPASLEDAGPQLVPHWAVFLPGAANEADQTATYVVRNVSNPALFAVLPRVGADGTLTYQAAPGVSGTATFDVFVRDDGGINWDGVDESPAQKFTITILPVNDAPTAAADSYELWENQAFSTVFSELDGVLANDSDPDGDALAIALLTGPAHGKLGLNSNGSFYLWPESNYYGLDSFSYKISDGHGGFDVGRVDLVIRHVNQQPTFLATDPPAVHENAGPQEIYGWAHFIGGPPNESDDEVDEYRVTYVADPTLFAELPHVRADGTLTYTPAPGVSGTTTFQVIVQDDGGTSNDGVDTSEPREFTITILPVNDAPTAAADAYELWENQAFSTVFSELDGVLANDSDPDGDALAIALLTGPAHGKLGLNSDGSFYLWPEPKYYGLDSFSYKISDGQGGFDVGRVQLVIRQVNQQPTFIATDPPAAHENAGPQEIHGWAHFSGGPPNESDDEVDEYRVAYVADPTLFAELPHVRADGTLTYTPAPGVSGTTTFQVIVQDDGGTSNDGVDTSEPREFTITILPVNDAPTALADHYSVVQGTPLTVAAAAGLLANDSDADSPTLAASLLTGPVHGVVTVNADGSFQYQPASGFVGADSFTYQAADGVGAVAVGQVHIAVTAYVPATYDPYQSLGGFVKQIVSVPSAAGVVLFGIGGDNAAWLNSSLTGGAWQSLGGYVKQIAAATNTANQPVLLAIGGDNALWVNADLTPGGWQSAGGYVKQIAAAPNAAGAFAIGGDNALWVNTSLTSGGWQSAGGYVTQIAVTQNAGGAPVVFAIGGDHAVWTNSTFLPSGWSSAGGWVSQIAVTRDFAGNPVVFAIGGDHALYFNSALTPQGWDALGGYVKQIAVDRHADGTLSVFAIGGDNALWVRAQLGIHGPFQAWTSLGGGVKSVTTAHNADGTLALFAIGMDKAAWLRQQQR